MKQAAYSHCSYCGTAYPKPLRWPRRCPACGETVWRNPLPVAVGIVPVLDGERTGVLLIRRGIDPGKGGVTLPGGYIETGESWQAAIVRELEEELDLRLDAAKVSLLWTTTSYREESVHAPAQGALLLFGVTQTVGQAELPRFEPNREVSERLITYSPRPLVFSTHETALKRYFNGREAAS